jgi:hypothetical protein
MDNLPLFIVYYFVAGVAILGSVNVLITIGYQFNSMNTCSTILIFFLHLSLVAEEIFALPHVYSYDSTVCIVAESFFEYFGLMNILVVGAMVYTHRWSILDPSVKVRGAVIRVGEAILFIFPMIVFIPFADEAYVLPNSPWCSRPYSAQDLRWYLGVYLAWVWVVLIGSIISSIDLSVRITLTSKRLLKSYLTSIGLYTIISLICWIPRTLARFLGPDNDYTRFVAYIPIYLSGMCYAYIFKRNQVTMEMYELSRMDSYIVEQADLMFVFDEKDRLSLESTNSDSEPGDRLLSEDDIKYITNQVTRSSADFSA